uniref:DDE Tnp4 domain-containing protein n=1 Tax=Fagus sylvatica TaxID=28930 RepID=A0A2N9IJ78_FAGSY
MVNPHPPSDLYLSRKCTNMISVSQPLLADSSVVATDLLIDCVGAIDGTHIHASVPIEIQGRFRGRKDGTTQNVLAAITFDLKFCYVLAGWEDSAHDSRVLDDALHRTVGILNQEAASYHNQIQFGTFIQEVASQKINGSLETDLSQVGWVPNTFPSNPLAPES